MNILYNNFDFCSSSFRDFFSKFSLSKPFLNIFPEVLTSMISSRSCVTNSIALNCKGDKFDFIQPDSVDRRIRRFFNNPNYNPYEIYDFSSFFCSLFVLGRNLSLFGSDVSKMDIVKRNKLWKSRFMEYLRIP